MRTAIRTAAAHSGTGSTLTVCLALGVGATASAQGVEETLTFQQGANGYAGTQDTWVNEDAPNTSYGGDGTRWVDDDTANSFWSDYAGQALLRFDGLIGEATDQIPPGSQIVFASLSIHVVEDNDSPFWTPTVYVHQMTRGWDEGSTWNSLGGGLSVPADMHSHFRTFTSDNEPEDASLRELDCTAVVNDWFHGGDGTGTPNWGFAFTFEYIDGNDDGIEIATSENSNASIRPMLRVTFIRPEPPPPPEPDPGDANGDGIVNASDLATILARWGAVNPDDPVATAADFNDDGWIDGEDLLQVLSNWT